MKLIQKVFILCMMNTASLILAGPSLCQSQKDYRAIENLAKTATDSGLSDYLLLDHFDEAFEEGRPLKASLIEQWESVMNCALQYVLDQGHVYRPSVDTVLEAYESYKDARETITVTASKLSPFINRLSNISTIMKTSIKRAPKGSPVNDYNIVLIISDELRTKIKDLLDS